MQSNASGVERFKKLCSERGLSVTHQRQVIYDALMGMQDHPNPESVTKKYGGGSRRFRWRQCTRTLRHS